MRIPPNPSPKTALEAREAQGGAIASAETARQSLDRARGDLTELRQALDRLKDLGASFEMLAWRLSTLSLNTASEALRAGPGGRAFMSVVDKLTAMARHCAALVRDLEASVQTAVTSVDSLLALTEEARRAVERLIPALGALAEASARVSAPPVPVTVVVQAAPASADSGVYRGDDGLSDIVAAGWPTLRANPGKLKN